MEQALLPDLDAAAATFRAFNRWMDEDWGFAYKERIFGAPYITLCKPDNAVRELEWALERDARFIVMVPGPITTDVGMRAPGDPMFDDFWRLANDSGITVCYHSGETYYSKFMPAWGEPDYMMSFQALLGFRSAVLRGRTCRTRSPTICTTVFSPVPQPPDGIHRKRIGVGVSPLREADQVVRPDTADLQGRSAGNLQAPCLGVAVLRGRIGEPAASCSA